MSLVKNEMSKAEKQAVADYIRKVADMLWLKDWDFDIYFEKVGTPDDKSIPGEEQQWGMQIEQTRHRKHATITLPPDFRTRYRKPDQKQGIAHELIHCHWAMCWDQVRIDLYDPMKYPGYDQFTKSFERNLEYGVDALAYAFAEFLPDIEWPKKK